MIFSRGIKRKKNTHYVVFAIVLLCGLVTSGIIYLEEYKHAHVAQKVSGVRFTEKLTQGLFQYAQGLSSVASLIQSNQEDVLPEHFARFIQNVSTPLEAGFYFSQYVSEDKRHYYEMRQKMVLKNDAFTIKPEGNRAEYLPLTLGYPNNIYYGYDIFSSQYWRADSVKNARSSLEINLSEPTQKSLFKNGSLINTFILRVPIYLPVEARSYKLTDNNGFYGIVSAYFEINDLLKQIGSFKSGDVFYRISDIKEIEDQAVWFTEFSDKSVWDEGEYDTQFLSFAGREWRVDTRYSAGLEHTIHWRNIISPFALSVIMTLFLFFYMKKASLQCNLELALLRKRIETDELTGLLSRYQIQQVLTNLIAGEKKQDKWIATLVLDLDHFKTINDAFGHEVGDKLLVKVAQRLGSILPEEAILGYLGGDAFVVLLASNDEQEIPQLDVIVKEIIQQLSQSYFVDGRTLNIGCSIGVALYPEFGTDAVTLIKNADMAVYKAKTLGRATCHFYDGEMGRQFARNVRIETRLRQALLNEAFELHYQPKVDIITERCVGMEVLLRWEDDELGTVSPAEFIPIAEQTGIIIALGTWVFEQAFRHILEWQEQGISVPPIAINCSAEQLKRPDFLPTLLALLDKYKVDPSLLEIEVTESILIEDAEGCAELLCQISRLGVKLAIDDFGTGYSSLSYLKDLPFDYLKIDQVFIRDITEDKDHAALTHAIIGLSHNLNLEVIAEGITNVDQLIMLQEFGCDIGQGYLFSKSFGANSVGTDPMIVALNEKEGSS